MYGKNRSGDARAVLTDSDGVLLQMAGRFTDAALNGRLFYAANQTPVATSTTLNTTFTGLGLCNPAGSGKIIIVHEFGYALDQASAGEAVLALATTTDSGFATDITPRCTRNAYAASIAIADASVTIIAPVIIKIIGSIGQGADTTQLMPPATIINLGGSIILDPGRALVTDTTVATGATSIQFSFMWEEISA